MISWRLFHDLIPWRELSADNVTIARRERFDTSILRTLSEIGARIPTPFFALIALAYIGLLASSGSAPSSICLNSAFLLSPLIILFPSLLIWILPLGLVLGPLIAREREDRSWEVLRATPFTTEEIVLTKARGALWSLRQSLERLWSIQGQVLVAVAIGGGLMIVFANVLEGTATQRANPDTLLCAGLLLIILAGFAVFLLDRAQQLILMIVAALAISARATTVRSGLSTAIIAAFLAWSLDTGIGLLVLIAQPPGVVNDLSFSAAILVLLGPLAGYITELAPLQIILPAGITLILREVAIRALWRIALHSAQTL